MISCAGIDVSKATLDIGLWPQDSTFQVDNTPEGIAIAIDRLRGLGVGRVLLEATGGYEKRAVSLLARAGFQASCINPRRARQFALAMGRKAKTDKIDVLMLAQFAQKLDTYPAVKPSNQRDELAALVKQRDRFVQQRDDDKRRLKMASHDVVRANYTDHIAYLNTRIKALEQCIEQALKTLDSRTVALMRMVKGVGLITTAGLMAYLPELGTLNRRQITALVGLAPYNNDSGTKSGRRQIWGGRQQVRRLVYMSSWCLVRFNPDFKARYEGLIARGKAPKVAIVACMRVLIVRLNAMVRDRTPMINRGLPVATMG
ncbi:IS110 family transposase [Pseudomonas massiliensis]|uniref:IS110 family transposase n=1 Tax=Pseudomonas massiliensis TaxID=522492 RepID=UPI00058C263A|nr:IS110 family transposase [Pseudomonas massiliensis]